MMGSLDPLGMPLSTDVLSGERADDGLYLPIIARIRTGLKTSGLLFVGDCKMSALGTGSVEWGYFLLLQQELRRFECRKVHAPNTLEELMG
jgi:hypothetical protein